MTSTDNGAEGPLSLEDLVDAAKQLDRWSLERFRARIDDIEREDSPELDILTVGASRLSRAERHQLHQRISHLQASRSDSEHDLDDDMDYAETLRNKNFLG
jgi:hypothetical protein